MSEETTSIPPVVICDVASTAQEKAHEARLHARASRSLTILLPFFPTGTSPAGVLFLGLGGKGEGPLHGLRSKDAIVVVAVNVVTA